MRGAQQYEDFLRTFLRTCHLGLCHGISKACSINSIKAAASANLGGPWSAGLLVVQDGRKRLPESTQNFKLVPWAEVAKALGLP